MWAMSLITYFRHICNSLNVSGKPWLGDKEDGSKWSYTPFPVPGHILSCRDLFIWRSSPFLFHPCVKSGLLTGALRTSQWIIGYTREKKKGRGQAKKVPFGPHSLSAIFQRVTSWNPMCNAILSHVFLWFCFENGYWSTAHGAFHSWPLPTINTQPDG